MPSAELLSLDAFGGYQGVTVLAEPWAGVEIPSTRRQFLTGWQMSMPHHQEVNCRVPGHGVKGPLSLPGCCDISPIRMGAVTIMTEGLSDRDREIGRNQPICPNSERGSDQPVEQAVNTTMLMQAIPMNTQDSPVSSFETDLLRRKSDSGEGIPEGIPPAVMISANHQDGELSTKLSQCRGECEIATGHDMTPGEPEIINIASEKERISRLRNAVKKIEQCLFIAPAFGGGSCQMGVGNHDQSLSDHGAKGEP